MYKQNKTPAALILLCATWCSRNISVHLKNILSNTRPKINTPQDQKYTCQLQKKFKYSTYFQKIISIWNSSTFKHFLKKFKHFQGPLNLFLKFKHFQGLSRRVRTLTISERFWVSRPTRETAINDATQKSSTCVVWPCHW